MKGLPHIPKVKAPEGFSRRVMDRILTETIPRRTFHNFRLPLAMAAAVLLSFGLGMAASFLLSVNEERSHTVQVRFTLYAPEAREVSLAGDFNEWSTDAAPLVPEGNGVWIITIPLSPGRYKYMFLVDGKTWVPDPGANRYTNDGFGGRNAVLDLS